MRPRIEALLIGLLVACGRPASAPSPSPAPAIPAGPATATPVPVHVTSSGNGRYTTLTEMKDRRTIYIVRADSFDADSTAGQSAGGSGTFERPQITFVDRSGGRTIATAPKAVLTGADKSVLMTGGVKAHSQDGNVLHCDRLRYDGKTERVHGDGHVVLVTPSGLTLTGATLDGDSRLQNVVVSQR
jgi:lipopolysaccharide assembly outer membrane protein LptD (OstA)